MANLGFGITATQINKVLGGSEWSNDIRLSCYMIASIAELPDELAKGKFVQLCNSLGIVHSTNKKYGDKVLSEMFALRGVTNKALSDTDKRKAIAEKLFPQLGEVGYMQLSSVIGEVLEALYTNTCKPKDELPFVMYRLTLGEHLVYRICQNNTNDRDVVKDAIRYLVGKGNGQESDYKISKD